jgi:hypothetical protein
MTMRGAGLTLFPSGEWVSARDLNVADKRPGCTLSQAAGLAPKPSPSTPPVMKYIIPLLAATMILPPALRASHVDFVVVNANASKDYAERKLVNGVPKPESYVFYEGKYFAGDTRDPSISSAEFMHIAKILVPNLAKQNYFPAKDANAADLLITVNWGTTLTDQTGQKSDPETQFEFSREVTDIQNYNTAVAGYQNNAAGAEDKGLYSLLPDPANVTMDLQTDQANATSAQKYAQFNARLLGYSVALKKELATQWASANGLNSAAETHLADLNEERYFVILLVYDYQEMQRHHRAVAEQSSPSPASAAFAEPSRAATTPPKPLWSVRINIRATGNNFAEALPAMSRVAADYFGKQVDGLKTEETPVGKNAEVQIGEVKVLAVDR